MQRQFTATAYVVEGERVLLLPHPKLGKWLPPGGHMEENETPPECAVREVLEETGLVVEIVPQENVWVERWNAVSLARPYLCLLENIPAHGSMPEHQHIDMIYLAKPIGGKLQGEAKWFCWEEVSKLEDDVEIFAETKITIHHILKNYV
jgi:8-oxo-dGTP pyrophosphatase MutT (NUDIX family)